MSKSFPSGFLWGAATASHQVEGNNYNDWSEWEKEHAEHLAQTSETSFWWNPHWKKFQAEATNPTNYLSGTACDHWNRYEEDFTILQELHLNAYRFSLEWSRIEPEEGKFDTEALEHYRNMILALRKRNIEPFVTLWHWTLPLWLTKRGGILAPDFPDLFTRYSEVVVKALGNEVKFWITLNEPEVMSGHAYWKGSWPPMQKSLWGYYRALKALITTHRKTYILIKRLCPDSQIGIAKHNIWFEAAGNALINRILKWLADSAWNFWTLNQVATTQDFIGLNHYNHHRINWGYNKNENRLQTDFGWEYYPSSLYHAVMDLQQYKKPIYITENGIADAADTLRPQFIRETLTALHQAIEAGANVRGYLYWSLLDNFEWDKGYWLKFGLVAVDRATQKRTVRESARIYGEIAKNNSLPE